jgi:hypothetical protein
MMRPSSEIDPICWARGWITKSLNLLCDPIVGWRVQFHCFFFFFGNYYTLYFASNCFSIQRPLDPLYHIYLIYFILDSLLLPPLIVQDPLFSILHSNFSILGTQFFFSRIEVQWIKSIIHCDTFYSCQNDGFYYLLPSLIFVDYLMDFQCL